MYGSQMRRWTIVAALASIGSAAVADPLADALRAESATICFARTYDSAWLKSHPGQTVREARFALTYDPGAPSSPAMRMMVGAAGGPMYLFGSCQWMEGDLNRGDFDRVLDATFKPTTGVGCHMMTDVTGVSAEEGGDFPVAWESGRYIQAHLPESIAAWPGRDVSRTARFAKLRPADRIIRLTRAPVSACGELVKKFAPGQPR
jgi:hypothetical protein